MLSGSDSSAMARKAYKAVLKDGKIAIEGVEGFSVSVADPKLNVGKLYQALFKDISAPTVIVLEADAALRQDAKAFSFFESMKKIVDGACEKMNPGLEEVRGRDGKDDPAAVGHADGKHA